MSILDEHRHRCPFCGSEYLGERGVYDDFRCGTYYRSASVLVEQSAKCKRYARMQHPR